MKQPIKLSIPLILFEEHGTGWKTGVMVCGRHLGKENP